MGYYPEVAETPTGQNLCINIVTSYLKYIPKIILRLNLFMAQQNTPAVRVYRVNDPGR